MNYFAIIGILSGLFFLIGYAVALWSVKENNKVAMTIIKHMRK